MSEAAALRITSIITVDLGGGGLHPLVPNRLQHLTCGIKQSLPHGVVLTVGSAELAVVAAQLGEEVDQAFGAVGRHLPEYELQCLPEVLTLCRHVGGKQIADGGVDGEPAAVEAPDKFISRKFDPADQVVQCFDVLKPHELPLPDLSGTFPTETPV